MWDESLNIQSKIIPDEGDNYEKKMNDCDYMLESKIDGPSPQNFPNMFKKESQSSKNIQKEFYEKQFSDRLQGVESKLMEREQMISRLQEEK